MRRNPKRARPVVPMGAEKTSGQLLDEFEVWLQHALTHQAQRENAKQYIDAIAEALRRERRGKGRKR